MSKWNVVLVWRNCSMPSVWWWRQERPQRSSFSVKEPKKYCRSSKGYRMKLDMEHLMSYKVTWIQKNWQNKFVFAEQQFKFKEKIIWPIYCIWQAYSRLGWNEKVMKMHNLGRGKIICKKKKKSQIISRPTFICSCAIIPGLIVLTHTSCSIRTLAGCNTSSCACKKQGHASGPEVSQTNFLTGSTVASSLFWKQSKTWEKHHLWQSKTKLGFCFLQRQTEANHDAYLLPHLLLFWLSAYVPWMNVHWMDVKQQQPFPATRQWWIHLSLVNFSVSGGNYGSTVL